MKNGKGFTLLELLVVVVIIGIISGMSIPIIRNVSVRMEQKKFNSYGDSLLAAAKIYRDSYETDLFGHYDSGCALVSFQKLKEKDLIKDFSDKNISCNDKKTLVRIVKLNGKYGYNYQLYCGNQENDILTDVKLRSSSISRTVEQVLKKNESNGEDEFDKSKCNLISSISIDGVPSSSKNLPKDESYTISVSVSSMIGLLSGSEIEYAWVDVDSKDAIDVDFDAIEDWNKWAFKLESGEKQKEKILAGNSPIVVTKKFTTPSKVPAFYMLVLKANNVKDLAGNVWQEAGNNTKYKVLGVYNAVKKYTLTYDSQSGSSCNSTDVYHEKNGNEKWGSLCTPIRAGYTFEGWYTKTNGNGTKIDSNTLATSSLKVYAKWRKNKVYIKLDANGGKLASQHGADYSLSGNKVLYKNSEIIHTINYGESLGSSGLVNYNSPSYLNIEKTGYTVKSGAEWILSGGSKTYDHSKVYMASDFCDAKNGDCTVTLKVNWGTSKVYIKLDTNGGKLASQHGADYSLSGNKVLYKNNEIIHTINYGESLGSSGLVNYNSPSYLNIEKTGYTAKGGAEWILSGGSKTYDHSKVYMASDFCDAKKGDCTVTLKVNWVKTLKVTFDCNGGTGGTTNNFIYGVSNQKFNTTNSTCSRSGYVFQGWAGNKDASSASWTINNPVSDDWINTNSPTKTVYAVWKGYTVTTKLSEDVSTSASNLPTVGGKTKATAAGGSTVTFAVKSIDGYTYQGAIIKKTSDGKAYKSLDADTKSFTMPNYDVYIAPIYKYNDKYIIVNSGYASTLNTNQTGSSKTFVYNNNLSSDGYEAPKLVWETKAAANGGAWGYFYFQAADKSKKYRGQCYSADTYKIGKYCKLNATYGGATTNYAVGSSPSRVAWMAVVTDKKTWARNASIKEKSDLGVKIGNLGSYRSTLDISGEKGEHYIVFEYESVHTYSNFAMANVWLEGCTYNTP